jgi:hypothetical protein
MPWQPASSGGGQAKLRVTVEGGRGVSEADMHRTGPSSATFERTRDEVLREARPLPPDDDVLIGDLTEDEDRLFLEAISAA